MSEERDVPTLEELLGEIDATVARLDNPATPATAESVMSELKNTILPLMKDIAASAMLGLIELNDIIDPVKLKGEEADDILELLKAFQAATPDKALQERIANAMVPLEEDDDDGAEAESEES